MLPCLEVMGLVLMGILPLGRSNQQLSSTLDEELKHWIQEICHIIARGNVASLCSEAILWLIGTEEGLMLHTYIQYLYWRVSRGINWSHINSGRLCVVCLQNFAGHWKQKDVVTFLVSYRRLRNNVMITPLGNYSIQVCEGMRATRLILQLSYFFIIFFFYGTENLH